MALFSLGGLLAGGITKAIGSAFQPGGIFGGGGFTPTAGTSIVPAPPALPAPIRGLPILPGTQTWPKWILAIARYYGPDVVSAVWQAYQQHVRSGKTTSQARRILQANYPAARGRRRMNPTNVRALRRAVRRVRSFQRTTRKVRALFPSRAGGHRVRHYVRHRRGDVDPFIVEDLADVYDTAEDLGYDPAPFREEEDAE